MRNNILHNHCYSLHKTKSRLFISIWQGPENFAEIQVCCKFFQPQPKRETSFSSKRSAQKKLYNFPIKLNHLCRTSRHVWLSSSVCNRCCAYQLICIMTISTYTMGARAEMIRLLGSCTVKK